MNTADDKATASTYKVMVYPKKNCRRCYGRGYVGISAGGTHVPCRCIIGAEAMRNRKAAEGEQHVRH